MSESLIVATLRSTQRRLDSDAADTIERLIRERDEARAEAADTEAGMAALNETIQNAVDAILEAEARGFERGIREAAKAMETNWHREDPVRLILALLELKLPEPPHKPEISD
jgi:chromosome segregation ATPase